MSANAIERLKDVHDTLVEAVWSPDDVAAYMADVAAVETLLADIKAWDADLSEYCDGPLRDRVRASIRRVESGQ